MGYKTWAAPQEKELACAFGLSRSQFFISRSRFWPPVNRWCVPAAIKPCRPCENIVGSGGFEVEGLTHCVIVWNCVSRNLTSDTFLQPVSSGWEVRTNRRLCYKSACDLYSQTRDRRSPIRQSISLFSVSVLLGQKRWRQWCASVKVT